MLVVYDVDRGDNRYHCTVTYEMSGIGIQLAVINGAKYLKDMSAAEIFEPALKRMPDPYKIKGWDMKRFNEELFLKPLHCVANTPSIAKMWNPKDPMIEDVVFSQYEVKYRAVPPQKSPFNPKDYYYEEPKHNYWSATLAPADPMTKDDFDKALKDVYNASYKSNMYPYDYVVDKKGQVFSLDGGNGMTEVLNKLSKYFDLEQTVTSPYITAVGKKKAKLKDYIPYLNDKKGMTIEEIADHLESLDADIQIKSA